MGCVGKVMPRRQKPADLVNYWRATSHRPITNSAHGLYVELLLRLDRTQKFVSRSLSFKCVDQDARWIWAEGGLRPTSLWRLRRKSQTFIRGKGEVGVLI